VGKVRQAVLFLGFVGCCILRQFAHWSYLLIVVPRTLIVSDFYNRFSDVRRPKIITTIQSIPITPHYGNFACRVTEEGGSKTRKVVPLKCIGFPSNQMFKFVLMDMDV
jgi:hypothetical protein